MNANTENIEEEAETLRTLLPNHATQEDKVDRIADSENIEEVAETLRTLLPNDAIQEVINTTTVGKDLDLIAAKIMAFSDESIDDSIADPNFEPSDTEMGGNQMSQQSDTDSGDISTEINIQTATEKPKRTAPIKRRKKQNPKYPKLTQDQKSDRNKRKHPMRPPCPGICKNSCQTFTEEERHAIWLKYWSLDYTTRRKWLSKNVHLVSIKRRTVVLADPNSARKKVGHLYFLPKQGQSLKVCRLFPLNTLGFTNDSVITELCLAIKSDPIICSNVKENRGSSSKKCDRELIVRHIETYNPCVSHYRRHNAPNIRYLPRELILKKMCEDFAEKHANICKLEVYRQTLKSEHVSFFMPKSDKCVDCGTFEKRTEDVRNSENNDDLVKSSEELKLHKEKSAKALTKYEEDFVRDVEQTLRVFTMDLQKVILIPNMPSIKDSYFVSRLVVFNETVAPLQKKGPKTSYCVLWHEAIGGRNGFNIVDAILKFFEQERDAQDFILWAGNCSAQNKNWILFTALIASVNKENGPKTITIRYLTKGHTHMTADGVHGNIEKRISRLRNIYDYNDLKNAIRTTRRNIEVVDLTAFRKWDKKKRQPRKNDDPLKDFLMNSLVEVNFQRGSREMRYKLDFDDEYKNLDFPQKKIIIENYTPDLVDVRGIRKEKKEKILQVLVPLMPANRKLFWESLPINNTSRDLLTNIDVDEDV